GFAREHRLGYTYIVFSQQLVSPKFVARSDDSDGAGRGKNALHFKLANNRRAITGITIADARYNGVHVFNLFTLVINHRITLFDRHIALGVVNDADLVAAFYRHVFQSFRGVVCRTLRQDYYSHDFFSHILNTSTSSRMRSFLPFSNSVSGVPLVTSTKNLRLS